MCIRDSFNMLSEKYQNEQKELETKIRQLHETMEAAVQTAACFFFAEFLSLSLALSRRFSSLSSSFCEMCIRDSLYLIGCCLGSSFKDKLIGSVVRY